MDLCAYNAAFDGDNSALIDAAYEIWRDSDNKAFDKAAKYIVDCENELSRYCFILLKNAGMSSELRDLVKDGILFHPYYKIAVEGSTFLNDIVFSVSDIMKNNRGTYWSLDMIDDLYVELERCISQYEIDPSNRNYSQCINTYTLYLTYLMSTYDNTYNTLKTYNSSLFHRLFTSKGVEEAEKQLIKNYETNKKLLEIDINSAYGYYAIDEILKSFNE